MSSSSSSCTHPTRNSSSSSQPQRHTASNRLSPVPFLPPLDFANLSFGSSASSRSKSTSSIGLDESTLPAYSLPPTLPSFHQTDREANPLAGSSNVNKPMPPPPQPQPLPPPSVYKPMPQVPPAPPSSYSSMSDGSGTGQDRIGESSSSSSTKRVNPLIELIDSERVYVDHLGLVIRRVAAAWSRANFPPLPLDKMFRRVEAVYKSNRSFGLRLDEIGSNPSSPKALGDLLMQWIEDLEVPYSRYSDTYMSGFDRYNPIRSNSKLQPILDSISISHPPPTSSQSSRWTIDSLFLLPYIRLRYYKKLYARLLRSTKEGKSDHRMLLVANDRLDKLIEQVESRLGVDVNAGEDDDDENEGTVGPPIPLSRPQPDIKEEVPILEDVKPPDPPPKFTSERESRTSSAFGSSVDTHNSNTILSPFTSRLDQGDRTSGASASTSCTPVHSSSSSPARRSPAPPIIPVERSKPPSVLDLEVRLDTGSTIDLFSMNPKPCRLQMDPPNATFKRELRYSTDGTIFFTPSCTGREVIHRRAHIFVLSDLFLLCEQMSASEKAQKAEEVLKRNPDRVGGGGPLPEMWLCYPPLAGKHLSVISGGLEKELIVSIMGRERFLIEVESREVREELIESVRDCIAFEPPAHRSSVPLPEPLRQPILSSSSSQPSPIASPLGSETPEPTFRGPAPNSLAAPPPRGASLRARTSSNQLRDGYGPGPSPMSSRTTSPAFPVQEIHAPVAYGHHAPAPLSASASVRSIATARSLDAPLNRMGPAAPYQQGLGLSDPYNDRMVRSTSPRYDRPLDNIPQGYPAMPGGHMHRSQSADPLRPQATNPSRFDGPQTAFPGSMNGMNDLDESPPGSPVEVNSTRIDGPAAISAQMKCKVFLKHGHQQWKSLGSAKLRLYVQPSNNVKQLVVEADSSDKAMLISTIVLTDGVERVGKTGVAIELSDRGQRTGVVYMIQLRNEQSAHGLFESLLAGSDRAVIR